MKKIRVTVEFEYEPDVEEGSEYAKDPAAADQKAFDEGKFDLEELISWAESDDYEINVKFENVEEDDVQENGLTKREMRS